MEGVVHKTLSENIQDKIIKQSFKPEGTGESESNSSSSDISQVENKNSATKAKEGTHMGMNGQVDIDSESLGTSDSTNGFESLQQKPYSPTLIESAFKVMKNLFSPDKAKSKPANIISPVKQHQSASGSPSNSIYITRKSEFATSESGIESPLAVQTGESSIRNQLNVNQVGVLLCSPITLESHNNTDESFLTTVSIIDDSFHSAITNLDENGETMKLDANIMNNSLNNSQNLDVGDPYNETLENSEYCLENTTLRNGSFALEGTTLADISVLSKDGNGEYWSSSQVSDLCNGKVLVGAEKVPTDETGPEVVKENSPIQSKGALECAEPLKKGHSEDVVQIARPAEDPSTISQVENSQERSSPVKNMNMEKIFLNKSFNSPKKNYSALDRFSGQTNANANNPETVKEGKKKVEANCSNKSKSEIYLEGTNDVSLDGSISTTTVVLNKAVSGDLDHITKSLEDVSDSNTISPEVSITSSASALSEDIQEKPLSNEFDYFQDDKPFPNSTPDIDANSFPVHMPQKNKSSISERDSLASGSNPNKIKLHKSDDLIRHRASSESPEGKRTLCNKESSLDVSLIKNTEASKPSSPEANPKPKPDCGTSELEMPLGEDCKPENLSELIKNSVTALVISQQSYTVLTNDKSLNRPVIDSVNSDEPFYTNVTFQANDSAEGLILESSGPSNYCNASLGAAHSITPSHEKHSTPLWKKSGRASPSDDCRTPKKPASLNQTHPSLGHSSASSKPDSSGKKTQSFHSNEDSAEFSPVNPINESELIFTSSAECAVEGSPSSIAAEPNSIAILSSKETGDPNQASGKKSRLKLKRLQEEVSDTTETVCSPNQTFYKKQVESPQSPKPGKLNQTFDKKARSASSSKTNHLSEDTSRCERINATFDKIGDRPSPNLSNKTFTKKTESSEPERTDETFVLSGAPECNEMNITYNKSFIVKGFNQTFTQKGDSTGPQNLSDIYDKKTQSTGQIGQKTDTKLSPPNSKITNQTYVKEKEVDSNQPMNETFQVTSNSEATDIAIIMEPEARRDEGKKASKKQNLPGRAPAEDVPAQNVDQQNPDYTAGCLSDMNGSFISGRSSNASLLGNELATLLTSEGSLSRNQSLDDLAGKLGILDLSESSDSKAVAGEPLGASSSGPSEEKLVDLSTEEKNAFHRSVSPSEEKLRYDSYLVQLIQEQFSSNDIEKICSVVDDFSSMKLTSQILKASEQFDKSIHENLSEAEVKSTETEDQAGKSTNPLSPKSFDFLDSIQGKPTGRDFSRESLYVKFDPLVQPNPNSLIDFTKEGKDLAAEKKSPPILCESTVCEQLLNISPQKKPDDIVPPLTPLSHKSKVGSSENNRARINELQNEIYFLKNLYAERERANKAKIDSYEGQVAKLTAESCFLENKLKETNEREKALVKKMKEQTQTLSQLKIIMEEYMKVIAKLTTELETLKAESQKQVEALSSEKDSYMTHLQNTEAAFTDVHAKYEKSKKTIVSLKANETMYRNTIAEQTQKMEDLKSKAREAQEKVLKELEKVQEELGETKASHSQEMARLRAQLRKTELKGEALQESLEQKIKENQKLTAICDELIEGKK